MLNKQQEVASRKIEKWYDESEDQIFTLAGHAGTGKTYLIKYLVENVLPVDMGQVAYIAPTAKAASVLIKKGLPATTIHRLIYINDDEYEINGRKVPHFIKKKEIPRFKLIIIDEVSMVSKEILKDIMSFGIKVLACGDPAQLPPVMAEDNGLLYHPDYTLTEIVRQESDNPIIQIATMARNEQYIPYGKYGNDVYVVRRAQLSKSTMDKLLKDADQIICGTNANRRFLNSYIRELYGRKSQFPTVDDKVICCQNNYDFDLGNDHEYPLANGMIGYIKSFERVNIESGLSKLTFQPDFIPDFVSDELISDDGIFLGKDFLYDRHQRVYKLKDDKYALVKSLSKIDGESDAVRRARIAEELQNRNKAVKDFQISQFDFGYAISCHKSQGSEWDNVIVFDESDCFKGLEYKWLYTAITRAKKKLIIIRG